MVSALNFKQYDRGSMVGFFDLRYHGMTIKDCQLMHGPHGLWIAFPSQRSDQDGEVKYFDQVFLTAPEMEHCRRLVVADLKQQGFIQRQAAGRKNSRGITPEAEAFLDHDPNVADDDIPF
jgi:DNA-binding cell septation regulator SpoVG